MSKDNQPKTHDAFVRKSLEDPKTVAELCRNCLPAAVQTRIDLGQLQAEKDSFVDPKLRPSYSDLLFSAPILDANGERTTRMARVFILIEHKSFSYRYTILQLAGYMVQIWQRELATAENPTELLLSPILPLILHHGTQEFTHPVQFSELFPDIPEMADYIPKFRAALLDLRALGRNAIPDSDPKLFAILAILQSIFGKEIDDAVTKSIDRLKPLIDDPGVRELIEFIRSYVFWSAEGLSDEVAEALEHVGEGKGELNMPTYAERKLAQGKAEAILGFLRGRFSDLPEDLSEVIRGITDPEILDDLVVQAGRCDTLDEFRARLSSL